VALLILLGGKRFNHLSLDYWRVCVPIGHKPVSVLSTDDASNLDVFVTDHCVLIVFAYHLFFDQAIKNLFALRHGSSSTAFPQPIGFGGNLGQSLQRYALHPIRVPNLDGSTSPVRPVTLTEILIVLEGLLLEAAVPPSPQRYGKVFIGPIEAARGLSFDTVLVPGLAEKMFPRKIVEEPILLDAMRERIGGGLPTNASRLEEERFALALAAGAAERWICFSYPRLDVDQARPRVPSFYALEAVRAAEGRLPDYRVSAIGRLNSKASTEMGSVEVAESDRRVG
jgi:hypothetical protein